MCCHDFEVLTFSEWRDENGAKLKTTGLGEVGALKSGFPLTKFKAKNNEQLKVKPSDADAHLRACELP